MKTFKIKKKRGHRRPVYILGPPVTSFTKPKIPLYFFPETHPPTTAEPDQQRALALEAGLPVLGEEPQAV